MPREDRPSGAPGAPNTQGARTAGQRDRDRILYSLAFRRLATVTQVVGPLEGYIFHNRLTHSLEVAQIARRLAERLIALNPGADADIDPDVVECAALAHDLGHPPFGHAAEDELKKLAAHYGVQDGFEGNAQSFRIVTRLAELNPRTREGLDLTRASLNAVLKYPWLASAAGASGKYGAYDEDVDAFNFARADGPAGTERSAEAQLMDIADDIAYSVHDVDDFYRAGLLPIDQLATDRAALYDFVNRWQADGGPSLGPRDLQQIENLLGLIRLGLPYTGTRAQRAGLRAFTSNQINSVISAVSLRSDPTTTWWVDISPPRKLDIGFLKRLVWDFVITNPRLASLQAGQRRIVRELFDLYLGAVQEGNITVIPPLFQEDADSVSGATGAAPTAQQVRLAIDIVASFADDQATQMARRVSGIDVGSIRDALGP